jgi:hypothetical protein
MDQQPPQQQRNSRMMMAIQIQLLLSNTLHRQLFMVNLRKYEVGSGGTVSIIIICRRAAKVRIFSGKMGTAGEGA